MIFCHTTSKSNAWAIVRGLVGHKKLDKSLEKSEKAGYGIWEFKKGTVSDLDTKLEVNFIDGNTYAVMIDHDPACSAPDRLLVTGPELTKEHAVSLLYRISHILSKHISTLYEQYEQYKIPADFDAYMDAVSDANNINRLIKANQD